MNDLIKSNNLPTLSKALVFICCLLLVIVLFVPLWQIQLDAPQYPEGLILRMYPHKLAGDVEIINGLNHYIGMKELFTKDFIEFTVLPYIIGFYAFFCLLVAFMKRRGWLLGLFIAFAGFGVIAMVDFYRWEYAYGHNLNPNAAIQVPGMSYQPPLIGFKQLLNFGAYSIPDVGGILFVLVGVLLLVALLIAYKKRKK